MHTKAKKTRATSKGKNDMLRMNESATRLKVIESSESLLNEVLLFSLAFPLCSPLVLLFRVECHFPSLSPISPFHVNITIASDPRISLKLYRSSCNSVATRLNSEWSMTEFLRFCSDEQTRDSPNCFAGELAN